MLGRKVKPQAIAEQLGVSDQSVYNWSHAWRDTGGVRPDRRSLRWSSAGFVERMIATALEVARAEPLTPQIAQRVQAIHAEPLPCRIETLGEALKREGFSFKRNHYALKKSGQFSPKAAHRP
ncbi:MAG TPA: helix-turn-helix domain-containing protein [Terriglobia bacterium]|nr:helix-turn-helix domain-containing protein [Terriglobia bacterium]